MENTAEIQVEVIEVKVIHDALLFLLEKAKGAHYDPEEVQKLIDAVKSAVPPAAQQGQPIVEGA